MPVSPTRLSAPWGWDRACITHHEIRALKCLAQQIFSKYRCFCYDMRDAVLQNLQNPKNDRAYEKNRARANLSRSMQLCNHSH